MLKKKKFLLLSPPSNYYYGWTIIKNIRYHPLKLTISCAGEGLETAHCTKGAHGVEQRTLESEIGRGLPTTKGTHKGWNSI